MDSLNIKDNQNLSTKEIDDAVDLITTSIQSKMEELIPKKEANINKHLILSPAIQQKIAIRRALKKALMRENTKLIRDHTKIKDLKSDINFWSKEIDQDIQTDTRNRTAKFLAEIKGDHNMFQQINRVTGRKRQSRIKAINVGTALSSNKEDMTKAFAEFYQELYKKRDSRLWPRSAD